MAPPVFKTGLAGIAFAGGFDSLPPPSAAPLRSGTQCGAPLVRLDPTRSLTYGVNRQLRKMREEVQFLRNLYEASSGFELHPPWTAYLSVKLVAESQGSQRHSDGIDRFEEFPPASSMEPIAVCAFWLPRQALRPRQSAKKVVDECVRMHRGNPVAHRLWVQCHRPPLRCAIPISSYNLQQSVVSGVLLTGVSQSAKRQTNLTYFSSPSADGAEEFTNGRA